MAPNRKQGKKHVTSTYAAYQSMTRDMALTTTRVEDEPQVKRETDYYLANIG
jgi:hypothetical protein